MRPAVLLRRNLFYYWRTNLAVVAGVAAAVAALAGALLVGDSVRASLRDLALLRLGRAAHVISGAQFFRDRLAAEIESRPDFRAAFDAACPLITLDSLVIHQSSGRRASGVHVYGVDDRFWKFHALDQPALAARDILLSPALAQELDAKPGETLLVRVEKPSDIPAESLHGRKDDSGRTLRFTARETLDARRMGEFSLRPQQSAVRAVFVWLPRLQKELDQPARVNTILVAENAQPAPPGLLEKLTKESFTLDDLGIRLRALPDRGCLSLERSSALIAADLAEPARAAAVALNLRASPIFTYVANSIRSDRAEIPYSLVTALDLESIQPRLPPSSLPPVILNDWAAADLGARVGDTLTLDYYVWKQHSLATESARFTLAAIVPIQGPAADRDLAPEYPGITGSDKLGDWDPPFPIDLKRIRPRDEVYWDRYRTTPKAFLPLETGQALWDSRFGNLTSIRLYPPPGVSLDSARSSFEARLRAALDPAKMGLAAHAARAEALEAARGSTDFGEYFVYFSFFLVASALLLAGLFFRLGVEQRLREIGALQAMGFPSARIGALFAAEGLLLAALGGVAGVAGALAYGALILLGLRTWWIDAVGTRALALHVSPLSLAAGAVAGVVVAGVVIAATIRQLRLATPRALLAGSGPSLAARRRSRSRSLALAIFSGAAGLALLPGAWLGWISQVGGFFGAGAALLVSLLSLQWLALSRGSARPLEGPGVTRLGFRNAASRPGRSLLSIALIASASFLIVAVDAFRRDDRSAPLDPKSGTGGFPFLAESLLPLYYDPNTPAGRASLNLQSLDGVTFVPFRLRPGDDASCLNLYQPRNPRILAPPAEFLRAGRFAFASSIGEQQNPWLLLDRPLPDDAIPAIADANSLAYVLHRKLGEDFLLEPAGARPIRLRVVAALADSIFQSELLISEKNFLRTFPDQQGYRFFLLDGAPNPGALEEALSDYGFDVVSTADRLAAFHRVENTYLSTFQVLGGLGLLLGTLGLAAVLLRNVLERRRELALLRAVGYRGTHLAILVVAENALLLVCGLATGAVCALLAIAPALAARGGALPVASLAPLLLAVILAGLSASLVATAAALRSPLLAALRSE